MSFLMKIERFIGLKFIVFPERKGVREVIGLYHVETSA